MNVGTENVILEDLLLDENMSRETIIDILDQKYGGDRRSILLPVDLDIPIGHCFEFAEEFLYRLVQVGETFPISFVVLCLEIWSLITFYETTTDEEEKLLISSWMNGEVTETRFIRTTMHFNRRFAAMGA